MIDHSSDEGTVGPTLIKETQTRMEKREVTGTTKEIEGLPETRETCRTRLVKVTERVTHREKLIGVTETCTREIRHKVT